MNRQEILSWIDETVVSNTSYPHPYVVIKNLSGKVSEVRTDGYEWRILIDPVILDKPERLAQVLYGELGTVVMDDTDGSKARQAAAWTAKNITFPGVVAKRGSSVTRPVGAIKALGNNRVGGYACIWGSPSQLDFDGEWFDPDTEELTAIFDSMKRLPLLFNHATDGTLKTAVVGVVDTLFADDVGLWYEAILEQSHKYIEAIKDLVTKATLGTSSGTLPGAIKRERNGRISRWAICEISMTPSPADSRQLSQRPIEAIKQAFRAVDLDLDQYAPVDREQARRVALELELLELESA